MAYSLTSNSGTISIADGSTAVTGVDTAFDMLRVEGGFLICEAGYGAIASVESDTALTLEAPLVVPADSGGGAVTDGTYLIYRGSSNAADAVRVYDQLTLFRQLVEQITVSSLTRVSAFGEDLAGRDAYDDEWLDIDGNQFVYAYVDGNGNPVYYAKLSDTNADWSAPFTFTGPAGANGKGFDHDGTGAPSGGLGDDGQTYLDLANGNTYEKTSGTWNLVGSIQGPPNTNASLLATGTVATARLPNSVIPQTSASSTTDDWNDRLDAGWYEKLLRNTAPNGPVGSSYSHLLTLGYTSNRTQLSFPYSASLEEGIHYRGKYNGTWTAWEQILPKSQNDLFYAKLTGDRVFEGVTEVDQLNVKEGTAVISGFRATGAADARIGYARTGIGTTTLAFYSDTGFSFSSTLSRLSGENGHLILRQTGSGDINLNGGGVLLRDGHAVWHAGLDIILKSYTVATVPPVAANAGKQIFVTNETGGAVPAFSDGTNWRRVTDRAVISA